MATNRREGRELTGGAKDKPRATNREVADFHVNSDVDQSQASQHHTIGTGINNAASGSHKHDGTDSVRLGEGLSISGSKNNIPALASLISVFCQITGVKDETT